MSLCLPQPSFSYHCSRSLNSLARSGSLARTLPVSTRSCQNHGHSLLQQRNLCQWGPGRASDLCPGRSQWGGRKPMRGQGDWTSCTATVCRMSAQSASGSVWQSCGVDRGVVPGRAHRLACRDFWINIRRICDSTCRYSWFSCKWNDKYTGTNQSLTYNYVRYLMLLYQSLPTKLTLLQWSSGNISNDAIISMYLYWFVSCMCFGDCSVEIAAGVRIICVYFIAFEWIFVTTGVQDMTGLPIDCSRTRLLQCLGCQGPISFWNQFWKAHAKPEICFFRENSVTFKISVFCVYLYFSFLGPSSIHRLVLLVLIHSASVSIKTYRKTM